MKHFTVQCVHKDIKSDMARLSERIGAEFNRRVPPTQRAKTTLHCNSNDWQFRDGIVTVTVGYELQSFKSPRIRG